MVSSTKQADLLLHQSVPGFVAVGLSVLADDLGK